MNRYGDTPLGMVESALEFARIARDLDYHALIFSMKSSNPKVMIAAYRLLVPACARKGADWNYPIHLGVTEAGEGEDARIKSAIGIGSLLSEGSGTRFVFRSRKTASTKSRWHGRWSRASPKARRGTAA
jgi:(E)-4-hydroxy-3-methylbut-2-enyl-diphosphate synthase